MQILQLTLSAVRITANSAFVIGTERRSVVFCMLFRTAAKKIVTHFQLEPISIERKFQPYTQGYRGNKRTLMS